MGTISISETPLVTLTGTYEWLWTTSQWKIEADTVLYVNNYMYVAVYARSGPLVLTRPRSLAVRPGLNVVVVNSTLYRSKRTHD